MGNTGRSASAFLHCLRTLHPDPHQGATMINRRQLFRTTGTAAPPAGFPLGWSAAAEDRKRRILMYTRSEGYQHDVVKREKGKLSLAERIVTGLGEKHGFEVKCEKDGRVFVNED